MVYLWAIIFLTVCHTPNESNTLAFQVAYDTFLEKFGYFGKWFYYGGHAENSTRLRGNEWRSVTTLTWLWNQSLTLSCLYTHTLQSKYIFSPLPLCWLMWLGELIRWNIVSNCTHTKIMCMLRVDCTPHCVCSYSGKYSMQSYKTNCLQFYLRVL